MAKKPRPSRGPYGTGHGGEVVANGVEYSFVADHLWVGVGGDIEIVNSEGATLMYKNVPSGTVFPYESEQCTANTTATDIVAHP